MRERLVRFRHAVRVLFFLDGVAAVVGGVEHLAGEAVGHRLLAARARRAHDPANGERAAPLLRDFNRHLISRAADAARLDLDRGAHVVNRALRSEEHTSELQSLAYLVCRLLLEKKNMAHYTTRTLCRISSFIQSKRICFS